MNLLPPQPIADAGSGFDAVPAAAGPRPAAGPVARSRRGSRGVTARGLLVAGLLLALLVPVAALRLGWSNPTAAEAEYRLLVAASADADGTLPLQARASRTAFDALLGRLTEGGGGLGSPVAAGPAGGPDPAAALAAGRRFSRWSGVLGVVVGAAWVFRVAGRGRRGRGLELLLGAAATPGPVPPRHPLLAPITAGLALLGLGLCLPLVQHAAVLGPAAPATAALLVAAWAAWEAAAGPPRRRSGGLQAAVAIAAAALTLWVWPRAAAPVAALAAWTLVAAAVRIHREPDPHRRFRGVTSVSLCGLLLGWVVLWLAFSAGGDGASGSGQSGWRAGLPLPDLAAAAPVPERLAAPLRLFAERIGWLGLAAPLAFAAAAWARPAAGVLLALLAAVTLGSAGFLADPVEADLLPAFSATLLAWSLAGAAGLLRLAPFASAFFQAVAERFGAYALAPRLGGVGAALALAALVAWGGYRSPGFYLTAAVVADGSQRGPYGRTDWARAAGPLAEALRPGGVVATSAPAAARFHLGRADVLLSWERLAEALAGAGSAVAHGRWSGGRTGRGDRWRFRGDRSRVGPAGGGLGRGRSKPFSGVPLRADRRRSCRLGLLARHPRARRPGDPAAVRAGPAAGPGWALRFRLEPPRGCTGTGGGAGRRPGLSSGHAPELAPGRGGTRPRGLRRRRRSARPRSADGSGPGVAPRDGAHGGRRSGH